MKDIVSLDGFLSESTYSDFMSKHSTEVSELLYQLKKLGRALEAADENSYVTAVKAAYKECSPYDKGVVQSIENWMTDRGAKVDDVAREAVDNQNRHGTETRQIVYALGDFIKALKQEMRAMSIEVKESAGFNPSAPPEPTYRQSDRKRVTAILAFTKAMFQAESRTYLRSSRAWGPLSSRGSAARRTPTWRCTSTSRPSTSWMSSGVCSPRP